MRKVLYLTMALTLLWAAGCSNENTLSLTADSEDEFIAAQNKGAAVAFETGDMPPAGLVSVNVGGASMSCWPFTGRSFDGNGVDPINLIFTGQADPMQVREALLSLDGNRAALGLPPVYPFDQRWHDTLVGGVQTGYDESGGWRASVIQLSLGNYGPVRFHLRLFRSGATTAAGAPITLGSAHFEAMIPGTSEHEVLSWEVAEQIVVGDMMRSGLLDPAQHIGQTTQINPAPSWRTINPAVYNGLPAGLIQIIDGPPQPQTDPIPIENDGRATTIHLMGALPISAMEYSRSRTVEFGQYVPRPFCSTSPFDWLYISGSVELHTVVLVDEDGRFSYSGGYEGTIFATPIDISTGQPVGAPFDADVRGKQHGFLSHNTAHVSASDRKMSLEDGGPQINVISLHVGERGTDGYKAFDKCLDGR
jgi:hypothetical protein